MPLLDTFPTIDPAPDLAQDGELTLLGMICILSVGLRVDQVIASLVEHFLAVFAFTNSSWK